MSIKPKVLLFSDWYLPGYKAGGPISSVANLVSNLGSDIQFKIVCSDRDYLDKEPYDLPVNQWVNSGLEDVIYLSPDQRELAKIKNLIREIDPDVVYINGIFSRAFSIYPLRAAVWANKKTVVAPRGMLAPGALGIKPAKKKIFLAVAKFLGAYNHAVFHATYSDEKDHVNKHFPNSKVVVIPNLPTSPEGTAKSKTKAINSIDILSVARVAPEKNTFLALQILSRVSSAYRVKAVFIGPVYSTKYFEKCMELVSEMPAHIEVKFEGAVKPNSLKAYFEESDLFFLPTLGENYGHAIIESMLHGVPVLVSDQTPWRSLSDDALGLDLPLTDPAIFTREIEKIAAMDDHTYRESFEKIAINASKRIDLNSTKLKYKELFR